MNNIIEKAKKIKLILMDVDGVLTKGDIFFDGDSRELKTWNVKDGLSFSIVKRVDKLDIGWITGRESESVKNRAKESNVKYLAMGVMNKIKAYEIIKKNANLSDDEIAYIGDDLIDIATLKKCALSICPADAVIEVKNIVDLIADVKGGEGVFRFALKFILSAQNRWENIEKIFEEK